MPDWIQAFCELTHFSGSLQAALIFFSNYLGIIDSFPLSAGLTSLLYHASSMYRPHLNSSMCGSHNDVLPCYFAGSVSESLQLSGGFLAIRPNTSWLNPTRFNACLSIYLLLAAKRLSSNCVRFWRQLSSIFKMQRYFAKWLTFQAVCKLPRQFASYRSSHLAYNTCIHAYIH